MSWGAVRCTYAVRLSKKTLGICGLPSRCCSANAESRPDMKASWACLAVRRRFAHPIATVSGAAARAGACAMEAPLAATRDTAARTAVLRCFIDLRQNKGEGA